MYWDVPSTFDYRRIECFFCGFLCAGVKLRGIWFTDYGWKRKTSPMNSPLNHEKNQLTMAQVAHVVSVQLNSRKTAAYDETLMKLSWCFFWLVVYLPL